MDHWAILAGCLAFSSVALSAWEIVQHLRNFTKPYLQRYVIRIMLMVPIYSLNAWFAMVVPETGLYLDAIREAYESFVIYSFMKYLLNFLNYDTNLQQYIDHKPGPRQIVPLCCLPHCVGGRRFLARCKHGILQYVVIRPVTALMAFASQQFGVYGEGNYNPFSGFTYPILLLANNASQVLAMYCLVIFYTGYQAELRPMRPLAKFFSIKLVVFFSFFQSVLISGLLEIPVVEQTLAGVFPNMPDKLALGRKLQELLICFDMLIAALGHLFAFTHKPYTDPDYSRSARLLSSERGLGGGGGGGGGGGPANLEARLAPTEATALSGADAYGGPYHDTAPGGCCGALCSILDFSEDKSDLSEHFGHIYDKCRQVFRVQPGLPTILSSQEGASAAPNHSSSNSNNNYASATPEANDGVATPNGTQTAMVASGSSGGDAKQRRERRTRKRSSKRGLASGRARPQTPASDEPAESPEAAESRAANASQSKSASTTKRNYQSID